MSPIPLILLAAILPASTPVKVQFSVHPPEKTPTDAKLYLAGNTPALGSWRADGLQLRCNSNGWYDAEFEAPEGERLEFKFTLGTWESVEKDANGNDIPNRTFTVPQNAKSGEKNLITHEFTVARWSSTDAKSTTPSKPSERKSTRTGDIRLHENFESRELAKKRSLIVYLPPGYEDPANKNERYPVLYMHDGQNLFDAATSFIGVEWGADETAERLIKAKKIPPIIIVGIYNTPDRMNEYTPTRDEKRSAGGKGDQYADFVVNMVKPFIDRTYRTSPKRRDTAIAGSSLGGLISLHIETKFAHIFSKIGVISPALFWDNHELIGRIEAQPVLLKTKDLNPPRIWLDMGTKEGATLPDFNSAINDTRRLAAAFIGNGLTKDRDFKYVEVEAAIHNEGAWAARFEEILLFFWSDQAAGYWKWNEEVRSKGVHSEWFERIKPLDLNDWNDEERWYHHRMEPILPREDALAIMLATPTFNDSGVNFVSDQTTLETRAFRVLFEQSDAAPVFRDLLKRGRLPGQLYALCGLWYHDKGEFDRVIDRYRTDNTVVNFPFERKMGVTIKQIVEQSGPCVLRLKPGQSVAEWQKKNSCIMPTLDIVGGGCLWELLNPAGRFEADFRISIDDRSSAAQEATSPIPERDKRK